MEIKLEIDSIPRTDCPYRVNQARLIVIMPATLSKEEINFTAAKVFDRLAPAASKRHFTQIRGGVPNKFLLLWRV